MISKYLCGFYLILCYNFGYRENRSTPRIPTQNLWVQTVGNMPHRQPQDTETTLYYLQSRYYNPTLGRFINADAFASTGQGILGNNMFAYCENSPVNLSDPSGQIPVVFAVAIGAVAVGVINNTINAVYYEFSDGESDLSSDSYVDKKPSRWDKLDYVKKKTEDDHYFINAWRYYSEYSLHEYGWYLTGWAYQKNIPVLSEAAKHFREADVLPQEWDILPVSIFIVLWGLIGI